MTTHPATKVEAIAEAVRQAWPEESGRRIIHTIGRFTGADWDVGSVIQAITRARALRWVPGRSHSLDVRTTDERTWHFGIQPPLRLRVYDMGDERTVPPPQVWGLSDYTAPDNEQDAYVWGRVTGRNGYEWKGYKNGGKVYLDWPELLRRWGPLTVEMIDPEWKPR